MSQSSPQNIPNADIGSSELLNEFPRPSDKALPSGQRGILRLTIWLSALGYAPLLVLGYVMIATVGTMAATLALVDTDGLFSSTFGGGLVAAGIIAGLLIIGGVAMRLRLRRDNSRAGMRLLVQPSVSLLIVFFVPAVVMSWLEFAAFDVPDIMSTTAILGSLLYIWFVPPVAIGRASWSLLRIVQRLGNSEQRACYATSRSDAPWGACRGFGANESISA